MSLEGDLSELPFSEIVQLYGTGRQPVAVHISTSDLAGEKAEGIFCLEEGKLTEARLGDLFGRDAFRCALGMKEGEFRVEMGIRATSGNSSEALSELLLEEQTKLDEDQQGNSGSIPEMVQAPAIPSPAEVPGAEQTGMEAEAEFTRSSAIEYPTLRSSAIYSTPRSSAVYPTPRSSAVYPSPRSSAIYSTPRPPVVAPRSLGTTPLMSPRKELKIIAFTTIVLFCFIVGISVTRYRTAKPPAPANFDSAAQPTSGASGPVRGVTASQIVFGMASPLNGANRELGLAMKLGVELAFTSVNEAGGIHGRKLVLVALDDGNNPRESAKAMRELVGERHVFAVVGNAGTATASSGLPYLATNNVICFGAVSGAPSLRKDPPDRYVFNYRPSLAEETSMAVRYLVNAKSIPTDKIAIFAEEDEFGEAGFVGAAQQLQQFGRPPAQILRVGYARNSVDVEEAVAKVKRAAPTLKAVVMVATHGPAVRFIDRLTRDPSTADLVFTNVAAVNGPLLADRLREARAQVNGLLVTEVVPNPMSRASALIRYRNLLEEKAPGEQPGHLSLEGYIVGKLLAEGLSRAGDDLNTEKLVQALESIDDLDLGMGMKLGFAVQNHQASHKVWGTVLDDSYHYQSVDLE
ncbi:MAG TPA: ABC transporter substrate-binding protein [Anaeromyxobacteraceae bacterium]|nr:ABC transporter substrate-binding protein [Anaeromyxobacteraceae bacterium]